MTKLATENNAINLAQGFPDFPCSPNLVELVEVYMKKGYNQYAPTFGIYELRDAISKKYHRDYGVLRNPETEITITSGATEAIYIAITSIINKGDEVIIFEPAFDSYRPVVELNGGICKYVQLSYPDFSIDWDIVRTQITDKTKLIIINSPHNPTGTLIGVEDVIELKRIVERRNIFILSDEVYEHIVFDNHKHYSILQEDSLKDRSFVVSSFGKTFHTTGWRIGYCIASAALTDELRKVHQFTTFSATTPMQYAIADFLGDDKNFGNLSEFYQCKRDLFRSLIKPSPFEVLPCLGTYFQLLNFSTRSNGKSDYDLAIHLTKEIGVASIPLSVFYHDRKDHKVLRFCFAKKESTLEIASSRLCKI